MENSKIEKQKKGKKEVFIFIATIISLVASIIAIYQFFPEIIGFFNPSESSSTRSFGKPNDYISDDGLYTIKHKERGSTGYVVINGFKDSDYKELRWHYAGYLGDNDVLEGEAEVIYFNEKKNVYEHFICIYEDSKIIEVIDNLGEYQKVSIIKSPKKFKDSVYPVFTDGMKFK